MPVRHYLYFPFPSLMVMKLLLESLVDLIVIEIPLPYKWQERLFCLICQLPYNQHLWYNFPATNHTVLLNDSFSLCSHLRNAVRSVYIHYWESLNHLHAKLFAVVPAAIMKSRSSRCLPFTLYGHELNIIKYIFVMYIFLAVWLNK